MLPQLAQLAREKPLILFTWIFALLLAHGFAAGDLGYAFSHDGWRAGPGVSLGRDFVNVFTAGHLVLEGRLPIIYDLAAYRDYQTLLLEGTVRGHNYSYSPVSFFYVWIFGLVRYGVAYWLWIGATAAAFFLAARPYLERAGLPTLLALAVPAAMVNVWAGHYGFFFGAIWLAAWQLLEKRPRTAGMLIGLMIIKPHLALLMPIVLLRRRAWTPIFYAGATSLGLVVASGLLFGWNYWATYLTETSAVQAAMIDETGEFYLRMMPTVFPAMLLSGASANIAWIVQGACAFGAIAALWKWMPSDPLHAGLAAATATFMVLPYAFNYDLTVVGIAALIALHRSDEPSIFHRFAAAIAFLLPLLVISFNHLGLPLAPPVMAGLLLTLLRRRRSEATMSAPALASA